MPAKKNKGGRPRKEIDERGWKLIEQLCQIQCTGEEIVSAYNAANEESISYDTLETRIKERYDISFSEYIKKHSEGGKASLRRLQWKSAQNGNVTAQIWLGKQYLGQSDKADHNVSGNGFVLKIDTGNTKD